MGPIEKEFDPTEFSAELLAVDKDESISSILSRVTEALGRTPNVVLVIPRDTEAFHSTQDFLALSKLQWSGDARVSVASPDPTIAGLARVLGFHIVDPPAGHPALAGDPSLEQSTALDEDIEQPTSPLPLGGMPDWVISPSIPVISTPSSSLTTSTWLNMPGDTPQTHTPAQTIKRAGMPTPRTKPRQTGVLLPTNIASAPPLTPVIDPDKVNDPKTEDGDAKARRSIIDGKAFRNRQRWRYNSAGRSLRWGRVLVIAAVLLVVSLIAGSAYAYVYLPEGTISVTPLGKSYDLTVNVAVQTAQSQKGDQQTGAPGNGKVSGGTNLNGTPINGIQLTAPLSVEDTAPATGTRQVPTGRAQGTMHFANTTSLSKIVPAGTQFNAPNGVLVETTENATVPPTDLLAGSVGRKDVPIVANVEGPDGNMAAGQLTGLYADALQYTNSALTGGAMDTVKVVTQDDISNLTAGLMTRIQGQVGGAIESQVQQGQQLITQTVTLTGTQVTADHKAGDDGDSVKVTVTGQAEGYAYNENDMNGSITDAVANWVRSSTDIPSYAGPQLVGNINHKAINLISSDSATGQVIYSTVATAPVQFTLTADMEAKIRDLVKGQDIEKAEQLITQTYGGYLDARAIQARVLWFNTSKLPTDPDHIVVQPGLDPQSKRGSSQSPPQQPKQNARPAQR
jgi:hypothetical protein